MRSKSGVSMALNVIDKVNSRLTSQHRENRFLRSSLRRLLCNALIQPLFDYASPPWFSDLSKRIKLCLQASQKQVPKVLFTVR